MPSTINAAAVAVAVVAMSVVCFAGTSAAWENSLGMKFVHVQGKALFCVWETRNRDFRAFKADHDSAKFESHRLNGDEQPVVNVSSEDARAFYNWLTRTERRKGLIGPAQSYWLPISAPRDDTARTGDLQGQAISLQKRKWIRTDKSLSFRPK